MAKRLTTRVDPRAHQFTLVGDETDWYNHIFITQQISLSVFGIHIVPVRQKGRILSLLWRGVVTVTVALLLLESFVENVVAFAWEPNAWPNIKRLTGSATALFTMGYVSMNVKKLRQLVEFYTINYNSWRATEKRSIRLNITYMIPLLWCVVLASAIDFAVNFGQSEHENNFTILKIHHKSATSRVLKAAESFVRMAVINGCISFSAFLYGTLLGMVIGNVGHLNTWMRFQEITELEENASATSLTQLRNLFHHQELNLQELDDLFAPVLAAWYLMCIINVIADIHMRFEGSFPGSRTGRVLFNLFMEAFPWWAIVWATSRAAERIQKEYHNFVQQMEQTLLSIGAKHPQAPVTRPIVSVLVLLQRTSITFPRTTLAGWIVVRRQLLLYSLSFFMIYIAVLSLRKES